MRMMLTTETNDLQLVRETIVMCLNAWKAKLGTDGLNEQERGNLLFKCFWGARMLLESYGPNPNADPEFVKLLVLMDNMNHVKSGNDIKEKKTLLDYLG